jgi:hypothetical protein
MFIHAIEVASQFTRPIHSIQGYYGSVEVIPGAASLFFVNADGWALTCKHVAALIVNGDKIAKRKSDFEADFASMRGKKKDKQILKDLEKKYALSRNELFEIRNSFINCIEGPLSFQIVAHPDFDVALIHFTNYTKLHPHSFPVFPRKTVGLKQGKFLCRLGFPFPEFSNFTYDQITDSIQWANTGKDVTPIFPIEGMLTRHLLSQSGQVFGFEMSTPGLRGQSGGPAFDFEGQVWGMQSATNHLDLDFDVDKAVLRNGQKKHVHDTAILHVGHCIHVDILKSFMTQHSVQFQEV